MTRLARVAWSWGLATADFLFAFVGVTAVVYPTLSLVTELLPASPLTIPVSLLTFVLAFGASYPYVAGDWPLGRLGEILCTAVAVALGLGVLGVLVRAALSVDTVVPDSTTVTAGWVFALAVASGLVYLRGRQESA